ncbi:hypothetical protein RRG08_036433 [Elysia crispata]|uniref:Uncharacterized protein n=1 Tax=Elysia crispata TaxID=231223 RepID=A0AAE0ZLU2_9GAST|nr:hypothetical protein RRG08_036433 [Elysia crispata]
MKSILGKGNKSEHFRKRTPGSHQFSTGSPGKLQSGGWNIVDDCHMITPARGLMCACTGLDQPFETQPQFGASGPF